MERETKAAGANQPNRSSMAKRSGSSRPAAAWLNEADRPDQRQHLSCGTRREMKTKIISLKYDDMFRSVFSHESVRKQFLSDVLRIPAESIRSARLVTPHLWKRYRSQKLGILDMALELNDDTKINVELQIRRQKQWVKRQLFYLAKMYEEDLKTGQDYERLRRCISIGILDFPLLESGKYHSVYRLRDEDGAELTSLLEVHIIELGKELRGDRVDGWIQLFNAESGEELDMLAAKYKGLAEATEIMKRLSLGKMLRYQYEAHLKAVRDRHGEDEYVRSEGRTEGKLEDILQLLGELGEIPDRLRNRIQKETDPQVLAEWLKAAARAESISDFENKTDGGQSTE